MSIKFRKLFGCDLVTWENGGHRNWSFNEGGDSKLPCIAWVHGMLIVGIYPFFDAKVLWPIL